MLGDMEVTATIAVKDIAAASRFYGGVLGLGVERELPQLVVYRSGNSRLNVYVSDFAGTNQATCATWEVGDIEDTVARLKEEKVEFEHYDWPSTELDGGDIYFREGQKSAWFKDPDGNILCLHSTPKASE